MKSLLKLAAIYLFILLIAGLLAVGVGYYVARQRLENSAKSAALAYDPIPYDPKEKSGNLIQAFQQNEIEKRKRYAQFLYISDDKVVYRWDSVKLDNVGVKETQFVCFPDRIQKIEPSKSWIDIDQIYKSLENGYRYNDDTVLDSVGKIEEKVSKLSKMPLILNESDKPMLVIFFRCHL